MGWVQVRHDERTITTFARVQKSNDFAAETRHVVVSQIEGKYTRVPG
jgi:hypothetical protein